MANTLSTFSYNSFPVHTETDAENEVWFLANDICKVLDFKNPRTALANHVFKEDVLVQDTLTAGGKQRLNYVNESGLYCLTFASKKPQALEFKHWVTHEVLPQIRKTGAYAVSDPNASDPYEIPLNLSYVKQMDMLAKKYRMQPHDVLVLENIRTKSRKQGYGIACSNFEKEFKGELARLGFKTDDLSDNLFSLNARLTKIEEKRK